MEETTEYHESFGMISWGRATCTPGIQLFGSELRHGNLIHLNISGCERKRDFHRNWYHPKETIADIYMSSAQFAEFMTTPNTQGVTCTIRHRADNNQGVLTYPGHDSESEKTQSEFDHDVKAAMQEATELAKEAQEILTASGPMKMADRKSLSGKIQQMMMHINSNLPFVSKSFQKSMENTVSHGKQEIEAFAQSTVHRYGLEKLSEQQPKIAFED